MQNKQKQKKICFSSRKDCKGYNHGVKGVGQGGWASEWKLSNIGERLLRFIFIMSLKKDFKYNIYIVP